MDLFLRKTGVKGGIYLILSDIGEKELKRIDYFAIKWFRRFENLVFFHFRKYQNEIFRRWKQIKEEYWGFFEITGHLILDHGCPLSIYNTHPIISFIYKQYLKRVREHSKIYDELAKPRKRIQEVYLELDKYKTPTFNFDDNLDFLDRNNCVREGSDEEYERLNSILDIVLSTKFITYVVEKELKRKRELKKERLSDKRIIIKDKRENKEGINPRD